MRIAPRLAALVMITTLVALPALAAQELQAGNWSGTVTPPDGGTVDAIFTVSHGDEGLGINVQIPEVGVDFDVNEAKHEGEILTFWFELPGDEISCTLQRDDEGQYAGDCVDADGGAGYMVMVPPAG